MSKPGGWRGLGWLVLATWLGASAAHAATFSESDIVLNVSGGSTEASVPGVGSDSESRPFSSGDFTSLFARVDTGSNDVTGEIFGAFAIASSSRPSIEGIEMTIGQGVFAWVEQETPGLGGSASADVNSIIEWRVPQLSPDEEIVWMPASRSFDAPARAGSGS